MRGLVLYKVFVEVEEEVYEHTVLSETLCSTPLTPYYETLLSCTVPLLPDLHANST